MNLNLHTRLFLSCDWGASSFRLRLSERATGAVSASVFDATGCKTMFEQWQASGKHTDRETYYLSFVQDKITALEQKAGQSLTRVPVLISGMASSGIGVKELPYGSLPLSLRQPDIPFEQFVATDCFPHEVVLISGVAGYGEIMRGEETQILGMVEWFKEDPVTCILPGTHSKHVHIEKQVVTGFSTYMTGELFELLSYRSVLSNSVSRPEQVNWKVFKQGVRQASEASFLSSLFSVRARHVLHKTDPEDNYMFLSGLIIGTELKELNLKCSGWG